ncbi:hypothetical protein [Bifidobacterium sp. SO1]|uniref:hypothetical protein n=1 Tax=Bifidobacterium sp. SO1 TaxID=2809029 RepID=UPI001BDD0235|nr:hypothetical protein [Bifidobacterium sp. SO1]MBT1161796.1 hypothetical protein [Bifidobacterium sp. SO1]
MRVRMSDLLSTPNTMDGLPPHRDLDRLRSSGGGGYRNLRDDVDTLPTPTSNDWNGGTMNPDRRRDLGHAVTVADWMEKSEDIHVHPTLLKTPRAAEDMAHLDKPGSYRHALAGNGSLTEDLGLELKEGRMRVLPTPTSFDESAERRRKRDHVPGSAHSTNLSWTVEEIMHPEELEKHMDTRYCLPLGRGMITD